MSAFQKAQKLPNKKAGKSVKIIKKGYSKNVCKTKSDRALMPNKNVDDDDT